MTPKYKVGETVLCDHLTRGTLTVLGAEEDPGCGTVYHLVGGKITYHYIMEEWISPIAEPKVEEPIRVEKSPLERLLDEVRAKRHSYKVTYKGCTDGSEDYAYYLYKKELARFVESLKAGEVVE